MTEREFSNIETRLGTYKYTSLKYTDYEEIKDYQVLRNDENIILIYGYNTESKQNQYHFACSQAEVLLRSMDYKSNVLITFVPPEWVEEFKHNGFEVYAVWNDYFLYELKEEEYDNEPELLTAEECDKASDVTLSCKGQSRGFSGQTIEWMKQWISGQAPAVPEYTENCAVLIHRIGSEIAGILCTGTYAHDSEKGAVLWIREIAVNPGYQRNGIAKGLIKQALVYGRQRGAKRAFLMADECNVHAIHLYESCGFKANREDAQIDMFYE